MSLLLSVSLIASAAPVPSPPQHPIVVTGQRIQSAKDKLRECLARNCAPDEDIDATLALAETQIMDGEYRGAQATLASSLRRNKHEAKRYPVPVSDLYRADSKVSAHLGLDKNYYRSTWGIHEALKEGLPASQDRKFSSLMEVAEMVYRTRGHERARLYYDSIAKQARAAGRPDIAALAKLRSAIRHLPPGSSWQINEIKRIASLKGDEMQAPILEATLALARIAYEKKDEQGARAVLQSLAHLNIKRPMLVYVPPFEVGGSQGSPGEIGSFTSDSAPVAGKFAQIIARRGVGPTDRGASSAGSATHHMAIDVEDEWLDVSFRITPEGKVADVKVLKSRGDNVWASPLLKSIQGRRYTPGRDGDLASTRIERYTYTSGIEMGAARRVATHSPNARIEYLDLGPMGIAEPGS